MHLDNKLLPFPVEILKIIHHSLEIAFDHGDFCAEIMKDIVNEILSHQLESI